MTQQNAAQCPDCGSHRKEIRLCLECATQHRLRDRKHPMAECQHGWHREPAAPPVAVASSAMSAEEIAAIRQIMQKHGLWMGLGNGPQIVQAIHEHAAALTAELARLREMAQLLRNLATEKPDMKLIGAAPLLLGLLEPLTDGEIKRGREIAAGGQEGKKP